ncbi:MAG: NADH-quinone oxidoreductase subunit N, partial [Ignavibacteriaceae bacterium]
MNINNIISDLIFIKTEIAIAATLVLIVLVDLISPKSKRILPYISLLGIAIAGVFVIQQFGTAEFAFKTSSSSGMFAADNFGSFFKIIVLVASVFVIFFSMSSSEIKSANDRLGEYYTLMFGMILGMFFMSSASDLILIYISIELLSLSSYVLAG